MYNEQQVCQVCGYNASDKKDLSKQDIDNAELRLKVIIDHKPVITKYKTLKQDITNTKIIETIDNLYQEYNTQVLIKTANYYNVNPGLLINLGLLDYQQTADY